jgi:ABC-type transport system substrate-binding protein
VVGRFFDDFALGDELVSARRTITEADVVAFAGVSGDFNALHTDEVYALLQQAGVGPITLDFLVYQISPDLVQFAQIFQSDLSSIGVTLNLKSVDPPAWLAAVTPPNSTYQHLTAGPWGPLTNDPDALFSTSPYLNPNGNIGGYDDPTTRSW